MRFPVVFTVLAGVLALAGPALGEDFVPPTRDQVSENPCQRLQVDYPQVFLTLSPAHLEIQEIRKATAKKIGGYLTELASASSDDQAEFLVRQIERAELDQTICILKVQLKHAHKAGQFELVRTLQKRILEVLESEIQVATLGKAD